MEFDEQEEQEDELESQNFQGATRNEGVRLTHPGGGGSTTRSIGAIGGDGGGNGSGGGLRYRYTQCRKNHAAGIGLQAVDGCGEFIAAGEEGTLEALSCAACNCHRNFHKKEPIPEAFHQYPSPAASFPPYFNPHHSSGYLNITPPPQNMAVMAREDEDMSNPSSSGGGGGGGGGGSSKKRHRTKFTQEQKDKMLAFSERLGWRFQKQDEDAIGQFCNEINVNRQVFKVWMHNNKHTMGKKL